MLPRYLSHSQFAANLNSTTADYGEAQRSMSGTDRLPSGEEDLTQPVRPFQHAQPAATALGPPRTYVMTPTED